MIDRRPLDEVDPDLADLIARDLQRQRSNIQLIASENYASLATMQASGSVLTNKYSEGYPGRRYYEGCEVVDEIETLAVDRARSLFGADYANVQPHSGSSANMAAYLALLEPGDTLLGMKLSDGGHLTHGARPNFSGRIFNAVQYGIDKRSGRIDYDEVQSLASQHKPKLIIAGFSAYSRLLDFERFREIADSVGAYLLADVAHVAGLIVTGLYPNPTQIVDVVTTTTHKTLRGPRGGLILARENADIRRRLASMVFPGMQGGPLMHVIAAKAVAFKEAMQSDFKIYQQRVMDNAQVMAAVFMQRGYAVVSGGTDNHLMLVNLVDKGLTGKDVEAALGEASITVNKNSVPDDPQSPFVTSGIRVGTPAISTRGFDENDVRDLTGWMCDVMDDVGNSAVITGVRARVAELCARHPVYAR